MCHRIFFNIRQAYFYLHNIFEAITFFIVLLRNIQAGSTLFVFFFMVLSRQVLIKIIFSYDSNRIFPLEKLVSQMKPPEPYCLIRLAFPTFLPPPADVQQAWCKHKWNNVTSRSLRRTFLLRWSRWTLQGAIDKPAGLAAHHLPSPQPSQDT